MLIHPLLLKTTFGISDIENSSKFSKSNILRWEKVEPKMFKVEYLLMILNRI